MEISIKYTDVLILCAETIHGFAFANKTFVCNFHQAENPANNLRLSAVTSAFEMVKYQSSESKNCYNSLKTSLSILIT